MKFACFGSATAVADEAVVARHRSRRHRRGMPFPGRFLSGNKGEKEAELESKVLLPGTKRSPGRREVEDICDMITAGAGSAKKSSSSVPSSSALSSAASLDSACSSSTSSSCSSSRSSSSSSSSFLEVTPPPVKQQPAAEKRSPVAGAAAVLVCLVMMVFCGRLAATLLTSAAFYFFPRQWPARARPAESVVVDGVASSPEQAMASMMQEETMKRKVVMDGFLVRNRKK